MPSPVPPMRADRPVGDSSEVRLLGQRSLAGSQQILDLSLDIGDLGEHVLEPRHISTLDGQHALPLNSRHRQREPSVPRHLEPLISKTQSMRGVLDVIPIPSDNLGPTGHLAPALAQQPLPLSVEIPKKPMHSRPRQNLGRESPQIFPKRGNGDHRVNRRVQEQKRGGIPLGSKPQILVQRVTHEVGVPRPGPSPLRLRAKHIVLHTPQSPHNIPRRFDVDTHLIMVISTRDGDPVHPRTHNGTQDLATQGNIPIPILSAIHAADSDTPRTNNAVDFRSPVTENHHNTRPTTSRSQTLTRPAVHNRPTCPQPKPQGPRSCHPTPVRWIPGAGGQRARTDDAVHTAPIHRRVSPASTQGCTSPEAVPRSASEPTSHCVVLTRQRVRPPWSHCSMTHRH